MSALQLCGVGKRVAGQRVFQLVSTEEEPQSVSCSLILKFLSSPCRGGRNGTKKTDRRHLYLLLPPSSGRLPMRSIPHVLYHTVELN